MNYTSITRSFRSASSGLPAPTRSLPRRIATASKSMRVRMEIAFGMQLELLTILRSCSYILILDM